MLAGAAGIDFALLVVAADDGVMPQTREHLAILDLLGIERGAVALAKADRVDAVRIAEVEHRPRTFARRPPRSPAARCSRYRRDGEGVARLTRPFLRGGAGAAARRRSGRLSPRG